MTQDEFKTWTGQTTNYTAEEWAKIAASASSRLARFLCMDTLPTQMPADFAEMYANFIAATLQHQGAAGEVESKRVRNFEVNFRQSTAANAFAQIYQQYGDVIEAYGKCGSTITVERTTRHCCDGRL